jgi:hypothetical protein
MLYLKAKKLWRKLICRRWFVAWAEVRPLRKRGQNQLKAAGKIRYQIETWASRYEAQAVHHAFRAFISNLHNTLNWNREEYQRKIERHQMIAHEQYKNDQAHIRGWFDDENISQPKDIHRNPSPIKKPSTKYLTAHEKKIHKERWKIRRELYGDGVEPDYISSEDDEHDEDLISNSFARKWWTHSRIQHQQEESRGGIKSFPYSGFAEAINIFQQTEYGRMQDPITLTSSHKANGRSRHKKSFSISSLYETGINSRQKKTNRRGREQSFSAS